MGIRPYRPSKDYEHISKWVNDERTHQITGAKEVQLNVR